LMAGRFCTRRLPKASCTALFRAGGGVSYRNILTVA
jgi:hypothetical protein